LLFVSVNMYGLRNFLEQSKFDILNVSGEDTILKTHIKKKPV